MMFSPLATYIVGIFGLMMLSLMETILVMYLLEKDSKENEPNGDQNLSEDCGDKQGKISLDNCFRGEIYNNYYGSLNEIHDLRTSLKHSKINKFYQQNVKKENKKY